MSFSIDTSSISYDWFILGLRLAFIGLIYVFIYQVARVTIRELVKVGTIAPAAGVATVGSATRFLEVVEPADSPLAFGERLHLTHYSTIGRNEDNSLVIADSFISGQHAEIIFENGVWWLDDLGSTNGTFVNDAVVSHRTRIASGDIVQFGRVVTRMTP